MINYSLDVSETRVRGCLGGIFDDSIRDVPKAFGNSVVDEGSRHVVVHGLSHPVAEAPVCFSCLRICIASRGKSKHHKRAVCTR